MLINDAIYYFACFPLSIPSAIIFIFCLIILSRLSKEASIFVYIKLESFFMLIDILIDAFLPLIKLLNSQPNTCLIGGILNAALFFHLSAVVEMSSMIMAIITALNCYSILGANKNEWFSFLFRINPYLLSFLAFLLSTLNFSYQYFMFYIGNKQNDTDLCLIQNDFSYSRTVSVLTILSFSISNVFLLAILVWINYLLIIRLRRNFSDKEMIAKDSLTNKRRSMEKKMTKLVLVECLVFCFGRIPLFVFFIVDSFLDINITRKLPLAGLVTLFILVSFVFKFFLFYRLNIRFRSETRLILLSLKRSLLRIRLF